MKQEPDKEQEINIVRNNLLDSESEILDLREALTQLHYTSSAREEALNTNMSILKEEL